MSGDVQRTFCWPGCRMQWLQDRPCVLGFTWRRDTSVSPASLPDAPSSLALLSLLSRSPFFSRRFVAFLHTLSYRVALSYASFHEAEWRGKLVSHGTTLHNLGEKIEHRRESLQGKPTKYGALVELTKYFSNQPSPEKTPYGRVHPG